MVPRPRAPAHTPRGHLCASDQLYGRVPGVDVELQRQLDVVRVNAVCIIIEVVVVNREDTLMCGMEIGVGSVLATRDAEPRRSPHAGTAQHK